MQLKERFSFPEERRLLSTSEVGGETTVNNATGFVVSFSSSASLNLQPNCLCVRDQVVIFELPCGSVADFFHSSETKSAMLSCSISCFLLPLSLSIGSTLGLATPAHVPRRWVDEIAQGYCNRRTADPNFLLKSTLEVALAASTQFAAEWNNRGGAANMIQQVDFVVPAVLTAIAGKYFSMWKTAPTLASVSSGKQQQQQQRDTLRFAGMLVPSNAFQATMMDGVTRPNARQRMGSLLAPILPLFRAGCIASGLGYGAVALAIQMRTWFLPDYIAVTRTVNFIYAAIYTGVFMAIVSNIRYQLLQGVVEPAIRAGFRGKERWRALILLETAIIFCVRVGNGFLGSSLAIAGMKLCGLQRLK